MATADLLLELMFSWIEQREHCAKQLNKLAQELETFRKKCNGTECIGSTVAVVGAVCLIGAGVATALTAGAAAPFLSVLGAAYSGVGVTISVATKITEHFSSSNTMTEAQKIEKKSNEIAERIQKLFQQLKAERVEVSSIADPDEQDQHVMTEIIRAMARRSGLRWQINVHMRNDDLQFLCGAGPRYMRLNQHFLSPEVGVGLAAGLVCILKSFTFQVSGTKCKLLFAKGAEQLIKEISTAGVKRAKNLIKLTSVAGFKTAVKGGAMVAGGAVGLAFELPEAIDNWKEMIKDNHVTEASQSLRDTADAILEICQTLREQFNDIQKMFDEMAKSQQEHEKKLHREKNTQQDCKEKLNKDHIISSNPAQENIGNQDTCAETQTDQKCEDEQGDQTEQTGSEQEGGSEQNEETGSEQQGGGDQGDEERDSEDEESDQEEEESDSEEETEDDENEQTGRKKTKRHRKNRSKSKQRGKSEEVVNQCQDSQEQKSDSSINQESNNKFETNQRPPAAIRIGLLNVWSMNNKPGEILNLITQNNLDVFLPTETWLRSHTGDEVLRQASPENFNSCFQARDGRGGGVAIQHLEELQGEQIHLNFITTFEYVVKVLQHNTWDEPIVIVNLYLPPGCNKEKFKKFLDEFEMLLKVLKNYPNLIVTGDFNIKVHPTRRSFRDEFYHVLPLYDLVQHVREPTHNRGNILDLVITRNVEISDLIVQNDGISDHFTVYFNARPVSEDTRKKTKENMEQDEQAKRFKKKEE